MREGFSRGSRQVVGDREDMRRDRGRLDKKPAASPTGPVATLVEAYSDAQNDVVKLEKKPSRSAIVSVAALCGG